MKKLIKLLSVLIAGILVTYYFFGNTFNNPNHSYFASGGDGAKDYFTMLYHIKHDTSYLHSGAMNYPYGENIFFCGAQPFLTNLIKFISANILDISKYTIAIHNLSIILGLVFTVLLIFLIFQKLNLNFWYSLIAAVGITFLSPQIDRFGGHFSLSYTFFIPLIIYLIILFHNKPNILISIAISLSFIIVSYTHGYFFLFYGYLLFTYWLFRLIFLKKYSISKEWILFCIQFVIPVIFFQIVTLTVDQVTDRTIWPVGYLYYKSAPEGVFISLSKPYWSFLPKLVKVRHVEWEGIAYVGLISAIVTFIFLFKSIKNTFQKKYQQAINVTDNQLLNFFFWSSFLLLLYSFGLPYILGLEFLLEYLGPLRQFRGIGRFTWLFFYAMNIITFYYLANVFAKNKIKRFILILPLIILLYDAYYNSKSMKYYINNRLSEFDFAYHNTHPEITKFKDFQCIMPLPYFNQGSENISIDPPCQSIILKAYSAALYTGLPLNANHMSRSSLSQCNNNIELVLEPYKEYLGLSNYKQNMPILLLIDTTCKPLNDNEKRLIAYSQKVDTLFGCELRKIYPDTIQKFIEHRKKEIFKEITTTTTDSTNYYFNSFEENSSSIAYMGNGALKIPKHGTIIFKGYLPQSDNKKYKCSFWVYDMRKDLVPRNVIELALGDSLDRWYKVDYNQLRSFVRTFDNTWGLIEFEFETAGNQDAISIAILKLHPKSRVIIDNLLIRPAEKNIWWQSGNHLFFNNRLYIK